MKGQPIKTRLVIFEDNQFISKHTFHRIKPSIYLFQFDYIIFNGYEISFNTTNFPIFKMQDFRNGLWSFIFD